MTITFVQGDSARTELFDKIQSFLRRFHRMEVLHEPEKKRFVVKLGAYDANLMYAEKDQVLDFYHIYVPDPYRERGIAERILNFAFQYARERHYKVVPSCPFIAGEYLPRHPEFEPLIEKKVFPFATS